MVEERSAFDEDREVFEQENKQNDGVTKFLAAIERCTGKY